MIGRRTRPSRAGSRIGPSRPSASRSMSRGRFIRSAGIGAATAAGFSGISNAIGGDEPWENKLYPTGSAREDRLNIQAAVERGGTVRLMNVRNMPFRLTELGWPPQDPIKIGRSVKIIGQRTVIRADGVAFSCEVGARLSLANIHFSLRPGGPNDAPAGICPVSIGKPADHASVNLSMMQVSIGNDDPWD